MSNYCEDCGTRMSGGFCPNCHEEVFIAEQYSELNEEIPTTIASKANEQMNDANRIKRATEIRKVEKEKRDKVYFERFNEYPKN